MLDRFRQSWLSRAAAWIILTAAIVVGYNELEDNDKAIKQNVKDIAQLQRTHQIQARRVSKELCEGQNENKHILRVLIDLSIEVNKAKGDYTERDAAAAKEFFKILKPTDCKRIATDGPARTSPNS